MRAFYNKNTSIHDKQSTYIVFEAGATHYGLESAMALVDMSADAGADAVKFQVVDVERLIPDESVLFTYEALANKATGATEVVTESLKKILQRRELTRDEWVQLINHAKVKGIDFFATATNEDELDFLYSMGVTSVKVASADINYHHLLKLASKYDWAIQIDTGQASIAEVEKAISVLELANCDKIIINHRPSGYPARLDSIHLRMITTLKQMFNYPIAFSDHSHGFTMDIAATALGVDIIEKTITLDRSIRSPEHIMSLEPHEAESFIKTIREVEQALGLPRKFISKEEEQKRLNTRRSIVAKENINKGTVITQAHIDYTRPGYGISCEMDYLVLGKTASQNIEKGTLLSFAMLAS